MPNANIQHACSHVARHYLPPDPDIAARRVAQLAALDCVECRREQIAAADRAAAEETRRRGFIPLIGSPKQVPWADRIRLSWLTSFARTAFALEHKLSRAPHALRRRDLDALMATAQYVVNDLGQVPYAEYWLSLRFTPPSLKGVAAELLKHRRLMPATLIMELELIAAD